MSLRVENTQNTTELFSVNKLATNPFINTVFNHTAKKAESADMTDREKLYSEIQDAKLPNDVKAGLSDILENGSPSKDYIDMLIARYEKKAQEFEVAWTEYLAAKNNLKLTKRLLEIAIKRYETSESGYDKGLVAQANKNYSDANTNADIKLDIASMVSHKLV